MAYGRAWLCLLLVLLPLGSQAAILTSGPSVVGTPGTITSVDRSRQFTCLSGGVANAYTCSVPSIVTTPQEGDCFLFKVAASNTGASTLTINSIAPLALTHRSGGSSDPLATGELFTGDMASACYDGTNLQVQFGSTGSGGSGTGDIEAVNITTNTPLTGGASCGTGACVFTLGVGNAAADGTTKGVAAFTATDFDASSGVVSLDFTNMQKANGSQPGALSAADWTTFNSKQAALGDAAADGTTKGIAGFAAADFNAVTGIVSLDYTNMQKATSLQPGALSATDWTTFNGKQAALGFTAENVANKSNASDLGGGSPSPTLYPTQAAVQGYVGANAITLAGNQKLTNKEVTPRIATLSAASGTVTAPSADTSGADIYVRYDVSGTLTIPAPSGSADDGQALIVILKSAAPQTVSFSTAAGGYAASAHLALPTSTTGDGTTYDYFGFRYNSDAGKWLIVANLQQVIQGSVQLSVNSSLPPASNPAELSNTQIQPALLFDDTTAECAYWVFTLPPDYSGAPKFQYTYNMNNDSNNTHSLNMDVTIDKPSGPDTDSYGSANACNDASIPSATTTQKTVTCSLANTDSMAAGDLIKLRLCLNTAGTATGDAAIRGGIFTYAK
jgi:hypothetical protein